MIAVIILDDAAQLLPAFDVAFERRCEIDVENIVADVFASMRSSRVVIFNPDRIDVVEMIDAKAIEVIQAFAL